MNILITGATGLIGQALIAELSDYKLFILTRSPQYAVKVFSHHKNIVQYSNTLEEFDFNTLDVVINLAGEPIANKRWSSQQKDKICNSRWELTYQLSQCIIKAKKPPKAYISSSAVGFYGRQGTKLISEDFKGSIETEFTHKVCELWENNALLAQSSKTRVCILRTGIVLSKQGGALSKMISPFKLGLGGPIGDGAHGMSWIHIKDMVNIIKTCVSNESLCGVINATAPNPVSNKVFSQLLSKTINRPCLFVIPKFVLKITLGEMADILIHGQYITPNKLIDEGFVFYYPDLSGALKQICNKA